MYGSPALPRPKKVATGSGIADSLFLFLFPFHPSIVPLSVDPIAVPVTFWRSLYMRVPMVSASNFNPWIEFST